MNMENEKNSQNVLSENIAQEIYGKSSNPFAEENLNDDFQSGYSTGMTCGASAPSNYLAAEWATRLKLHGAKNMQPFTKEHLAFLDWKRGFWAGRFDQISADAAQGVR